MSAASVNDLLLNLYMKRFKVQGLINLNEVKKTTITRYSYYHIFNILRGSGPDQIPKDISTSAVIFPYKNECVTPFKKKKRMCDNSSHIDGLQSIRILN